MTSKTAGTDGTHIKKGLISAERDLKIHNLAYGNRLFNLSLFLSKSEAFLQLKSKHHISGKNSSIAL